MQADALISQLELQRRLDKIWLHVDMDAFYATVEERDDPSLVCLPPASSNSGQASLRLFYLFLCRSYMHCIESSYRSARKTKLWQWAALE